MRDVLGESLKNLKWIQVRQQRMSAMLLVLSLLVTCNVFWFLRKPGWTLAGDASCGILEHTHDVECYGKRCICDSAEESHTHEETCYTQEMLCEWEEHVHSIDCYSDETADVESMLDWQEMFKDYPFTGDLRQDLVGIAKMQVGYSESTLNFEVGSDGVRRGYTRYGAWYGTPYRDWSAMFVSFCLNYAGADAEEMPGNTGAAAMAELWKKAGRYAVKEEYFPVSGDLVFFCDNTVGIVAEVSNTTCQVIRGDIENAVCADRLALTDQSIVGWGITKEAVPEVEQPLEEETQGEDLPQNEDIPWEESQTEPSQTEPPQTGSSQIDDEDLLDISQGPVFFIFEGGESFPEIQTYALRSTRSVTDLLPYLEANDGSYFFTLLNFNNVELPKDENGNYIAQANTGYKLTVSFVSPEGFLPGTYQYQVPNGLMVDGGEGNFVLKDDTNVGSWVVTDTGLITLVFNEHMNSRTEITISATLGIHFPEQEDPIDFDGKITVLVEKPPPQSYPTVVNKWGNQGGTEASDGDDTSKIYWGMEIIGDKDSQIPGSIVTDRLIDGEWSKSQRYTDSDIAAGLSFGASGNGEWHNWHVAADDPHLIWTETGWTYKMPKTVICQWCGELELGSEDWYYYIHYTSTPDPAGMSGTFGYENDVTVDGAYGYAWVNFTHGEAIGEIVKQGSFSSDAGAGAFLWEFQATIPGRSEGKRADYHWYIMDNMKVLNGEGQKVGLIENDAHLATVTVTYNGTTIQVPRIQDATEDDLFAWDNGWSSTENGVTHGREFNLLCRCQCTEDTCHWEEGCEEYWYLQQDGSHAQNGFCQCWTIRENVVFTFVYETHDLSVVEIYGGLGYSVQNVAELFYIPEGDEGGASISRSDAVVPIPGLFQKELTHDFDGYTANYKITINESKLVLTDGSPLYINDVMTKTLAYISGSLVITAEDAAGNITTLKQGTDYTVTYDGTGNQTDDMGKEVHVLDIVIQHPQPVMYTLDYDATLIIPDHVTEGVRYGNSATITLWGESIKDTAVEKVYADINIAAKSYHVKMFKTSALTGEPLGGATFGLYNQQGGLISTEVTHANGELTFQTNIIEGIILREHVLYYMQELKAPPGYQLDDTKHWFCFCDVLGDSCKVCQEVLAETEAVRIPFEEIGKVHATNQLMHYDLPATGGTGTYPLILVSVIFVMIPLVYGSIRRRKRERRGVG